MYLSTVPPCLNTIRVISVRYSRSISVTCSGSSFSEIEVKPRRSENSTVTRRRLEPRLAAPRPPTPPRRTAGAKERGGGEPAQGLEADHQRRAEERGHDGGERARPRRDLAERVAADQRVEGVGVNLDPRHAAAAREGRGEQVVEHRGRRPDQHDLAREDLGPDLAADHPVVRDPRERAGPAAVVDQ